MHIIKSFLSNLYKTDDQKSKYWILIFVVYVILLAFSVLNHEPWMDEAQAWLLAKDLSISELFIEYLRYEGSPGLWHLILMIPAKLGLPYFTINILSAFISALGVWLFLRYSPFPLIIKTLFPFSYFVIFQYGVVARSYCLIPPLLFLIALIYKRKTERPFLYVLLLCLLANVSAHTLLIAGGFLAVHFWDVSKIWSKLNRQSKINQIAIGVIFGLMTGLLYLMLATPPDHIFGEEINLNLLNFLNSSKWMIAGALVLDESSKWLWVQLIVSLTIFAVTFLWLRQNKLALLYLLPLLPILALFAVKYRNFWHQGILFLLWIFVLWVSFEKGKIKESQTLAKTVLILMTLVLAVQVFWTTYALGYNLQQNYSGSYDLAEYIKENELDNKKIFVSGWKSIAVLPYFEENIFSNHNSGTKPRFWLWSIDKNRTVVGFNETAVYLIQREQPDIVIFASDHIEPETTLEIEGYRFVKAFEGKLFWKTGVYESDSFWLFQKMD